MNAQRIGFISVLCASLCAAVVVADIGDLALAVRGKPAEYTIVIPGSASPSQQYAAEELRDFTEKTTGVRLPIDKDDRPLPPKAILLGATRHTDALLSDSEAIGPLGPDGFRIVSRPPHLLVVGSRERGTLYGVYELLERFAGCRFFPELTVAPPREAFIVPSALDETQTPAFDWRDILWEKELKSHELSGRLRSNSTLWREYHPQNRGEHDPFRFSKKLVIAHTFERIIPPDKYFDAHPEYFSLVNGKRLKDKSQLCLTNPDVLRVVTSNVLEQIRQEPDAMVFGVSQNDWENWCECPTCKAIDEEEGSHSGTIIRFVNAVAEAVEKAYPDKIIETLAYSYGRKPPAKTHARHNVVPCLCVNSDYSEPLAMGGHRVNKAFRDDLAGWGRMADRIMVWDYNVNFRAYLMPWPNIVSMRENLRFFRDNNVRMVFSEGDHVSPYSDFCRLKTWLLGKWMWNPDQPMEPLLDEFFPLNYGKAAPFLREYFWKLNQLFADDACAMTWGGMNSFRFINHVPDTFVAEAAELWKKAEEAVKDAPEALARVRSDAVTMEYLRLEWLRRRASPRIDSILCLADSPKAPALQAEAKELAKSILGRLGDKPLWNADLRFDQSPEWNQMEFYEIIAIGKLPVPRTGSRVGVVPDGAIEVIDPKANAGVPSHVRDKLSSHGWALHLYWPRNPRERYAQFPLGRVEFEPGMKCRLRVRARVDKVGGSGEAFWIGVWDSAERKIVVQAAPHIDAGSTEYAWYDVGEFMPNDRQYVWIGMGNPLPDGRVPAQVWIDCLELSQ